MKPPEPVTIIFADDHPLFRNGLCDVLQHQPGYALVGEAGDGEEAYRLIVERHPAIAILDVEMPKMSGIEVAQKVHADERDVRMIILTMHEGQSLFNRAMDAGVMGYILKDTAVLDVLDAISKVARGEYYISSSLSNQLLHKVNHFDRSLDQLTATEKRILHLISESRSSRQIAEQLCISLRTVENHRYNICQKLQLNGSYALLRFALEFQK
jgi:two-component system, NarL family, response regulator DegU